MKIKTILIISYLIIIFGLCGGFYFFIRFINKELTHHNFDVASRGIHEITLENYNLSTKVLTEIGQSVVAIKANSEAYRLADILEEIPQPYNYAELMSNTHLRAIATTPVHSYGGKSGYVDVYDTNGLSIWHPNKQIQGKNYKRWEKKYPEMWKLTKESFTKSFVTGYYTFVSIKGAKKRRKFMATAHVTNTPFVVCSSVYIDDYFLPVQNIISNNEMRIRDKAYIEILKAAEKSENIVKTIGAVAFLILTIIGVIVGIWFAGTISSPISELSKAVHKIANGDFSTKVKEKGPPEIVRLAASFNTLGDELTDYMDNLKKEVAVRETYQREMDIARDIQRSLLPRTFPPFPEHSEFSLYAGVQPAKEVAGDFFDFFFVDENTLTMLVGDVSGKSVPAALFMAVTRTLLRTVCSHEKNLAEAISYANNILCEDNDTCMFVTLFVANYNVKSGEIIYCNAGHHEACVLKENSEIETFGTTGSPALGAMPDIVYITGNYKLESGDKIILYTDGVTEAHSPEKELFGEARLFEIIKREAGRSPEELYSKVIKELNGFQAGENFDDITLLILERCRAGLR